MKLRVNKYLLFFNLPMYGSEIRKNVTGKPGKIFCGEEVGC